MTEHFGESLILIVTRHRVWSQLNLQIRSRRVPIEVVFLDEREIVLNQLSFQIVQVLTIDSDAVLLARMDARLFHHLFALLHFLVLHKLIFFFFVIFVQVEQKLMLLR